jgi:hypothetical protein
MQVKLRDCMAHSVLTRPYSRFHAPTPIVAAGGAAKQGKERKAAASRFEVKQWRLLAVTDKSSALADPEEGGVKATVANGDGNNKKSALEGEWASNFAFRNLVWTGSYITTKEDDDGVITVLPSL